MTVRTHSCVSFWWFQILFVVDWRPTQTSCSQHQRVLRIIIVSSATYCRAAHSLLQEIDDSFVHCPVVPLRSVLCYLCSPKLSTRLKWSRNKIPKQLGNCVGCFKFISMLILFLSRINIVCKCRNSFSFSQSETTMTYGRNIFRRRFVLLLHMRLYETERKRFFFVSALCFALFPCHFTRADR